MSDKSIVDTERFRLLGLFDDPRFDEALERLKERAEESRAQPLAGYPENKAESVREWGGARLSIVRNSIPGFGEFYCGYVRFPQKMLQSDLFMHFVPVHGGITFDRADADGSHVYGFDCSHASDMEDGKFRDVTAVNAECERLEVAVETASKWEKEFLATPAGVEWRDRRISIIDRYHAELQTRGVVFDLADNMGAMIEVLGGMLEVSEE